MNTERITDPETGERRLIETELVKRASRTEANASMLRDNASQSIPQPQWDVFDDAASTEAAMRQIPELKDYKLQPPRRDPYNLHQEQERRNPITDAQGRDLLDLLHFDLITADGGC